MAPPSFNSVWKSDPLSIECGCKIEADHGNLPKPPWDGPLKTKEPLALLQRLFLIIHD